MVPTGEALGADEHYQDLFSRNMSQNIGTLRQALVSSLAHYRISVLQESVLHLPVKGLRADPDVFLEKPLCVRDAFLFPRSMTDVKELVAGFINNARIRDFL
jgi:hypothetical protein